MYIFTNTTDALGQSLSDVIIRVVSFVPSVVIALILVLLGYLVGGILGRAVTHFVTILKIDSALKAAGLHEAVNGVSFSVAKILGGVVKWGIIVAFLMTATQQVGLDSFAGFLWLILGYIPNVLVAALILASSFLLADFVAKLVAGSARAAGVKHAFASMASKYAVVVVGVLAALAQLKIASDFMQILFTGVVAALSLALGLSFGLGGRDAAAKAISKIEDNLN